MTKVTAAYIPISYPIFQYHIPHMPIDRNILPRHHHILTEKHTEKKLPSIPNKQTLHLKTAIISDKIVTANKMSLFTFNVANHSLTCLPSFVEILTYQIRLTAIKTSVFTFNIANHSLTCLPSFVEILTYQIRLTAIKMSVFTFNVANHSLTCLPSLAEILTYQIRQESDR